MRTLGGLVGAAVLVISGGAGAQDQWSTATQPPPAPTQPPSTTPPPSEPAQQGDAWSGAIHRGLKDEGVKSAQQRDADEHEQEVHEAAVIAARDRLRFGLYAELAGASFAARTVTVAGTDVRMSASSAAFEAGLGVRKGLGGAWEMQGRAVVAFRSAKCTVGYGILCGGTASSTSFSGTTITNDVTTGNDLLISPGAEVTFRGHLLHATSPHYLGFGPRLDVTPYAVSRSYTATTGKTVTNTQSDQSAAVVRANLVLEYGIALGATEEWDLQARLLLNNGAQVGVAVARWF